jgi:hypothetical protein
MRMILIYWIALVVGVAAGSSGRDAGSREQVAGRRGVG